MTDTPAPRGVVAIANQKGGTGKTTTVNLAAALAEGVDHLPTLLQPNCSQVAAVKPKALQRDAMSGLV